MSTSLFAALVLVALCAEPADRWSYVDESGVFRRRDDASEVALFGVNYYAPFTVDHEGLRLLGEDHRQTIDRDVAHFDLLGLDAIRLHVFDRQISDKQGNLLENEHLDLFDYLVAVCKRRGIYTVLTPIAWWQYHTPVAGFSSLYSKPEMLTAPAARAAQRNYLRQFMEHVNPYTRNAYKDEPAVVAIELINEPLYDETTSVEDVHRYIDDLAGAVRSTGATQPIFYNGWSDKEESVAASSIEGCSFGWYPTGLVSGGCLRADYLPSVDDYPRMRLPCLASKAKIVYEFDAADVPGRVMYPAMARAFRSGGAQIATQFQYDPTPLAAYNYGWCTHYLNLIYAPGKTISFAVAAEAFRRTPRLTRYENYPNNARFGPFQLDFQRDLSVMSTDTAFLYSNDTDLKPAAPVCLERVAGCGSSPVVGYDGTGAYFLSRLGEGQWRLEVYPDAVWVDDPFAPTSLKREVSRVLWNTHVMTIRLPDLSRSFSLQQIAPTTDSPILIDDRSFPVEPGAYVLARAGKSIPEHVSKEYWAPRPAYEEPAVWWQTPSRWREGIPLPVRVNVAASGIEEVRLRLDDGESIPLDQVAPFVFGAELPGDRVRSGRLAASLEVRMAGSTWLSHGVIPSDPIPAPFAVCHIDADSAPQTYGSSGCRVEVIGGKVLQVTSTGFAPSTAAGLRLPAQSCSDPTYDTLVVRARATHGATDRVEVGLVQSDGKAYGTDIPVWNEWHDVRVPLLDLRPLWSTPGGRIDVTRLDQVSLVFGAWLYGSTRQLAHGYAIEQIRLEHRVPGWRIDVASADGPVLLFTAGERPVRSNGQQDRHQELVRGSQPGRQAGRLWTNGFGPLPSCISFRQTVPEDLSRFAACLRQCDSLEIVARATTPETDKLEVALVERDSTAWGTTITLTQEWRRINVPLDELRFFAHWTHPDNRGSECDRLGAENLTAVNFCFGAWLFGDRAGGPHGIEIESASLVRTAE